MGGFFSSCRLRKGCGAGCNSGGNIEDPDAGGLSSGSGNGTGGDSQQSSVSQGGTSGPAPPHSYQPHTLGERYWTCTNKYSEHSDTLYVVMLSQCQYTVF